MAQVRNISNDARHVVHLGRSVGVDELLDVPDPQFLDRAWPTETWQLITPPQGNDVSLPDAILFTAQDTQEPPVIPAPDDQNDETE